MRGAITLIEVIIVTLLFASIILMATTVSIFFVRQVKTNMERSNMWTQINYTLDDMRIRCISAISTTTSLASGASLLINGDTGLSFQFEGEKDIYEVTPQDTNDNVTYRYYVSDSGNIIGSLVLETIDNTGPAPQTETEVLIEARFAPELVMEHVCATGASGPVCDEPNFIMVTINTVSPDEELEITKTEGVRFWFLDVVQ